MPKWLHLPHRNDARAREHSPPKKAVEFFNEFLSCAI
jgi:hypothetical protein